MGPDQLDCDEEDDTDDLSVDDTTEVVETDTDCSGSDSNDDSDMTESSDDEMTQEGEIVWAPCGRTRVPAKVVSLTSVPIGLRNQIETRKLNYLYLRWIGFVDRAGQPMDRFGCCSMDKVVVLGSTIMDLKLAEKCRDQYLMALNELSH